MARQRASKPKVRTGCLTCKARHVKCNEEKPVCGRCALAGRTCDYGTPKSSSAPSRALAPAPTVNSITGQALELFFLRTAPQLAGNFEQPFFQGSVLQLSLSEPAIREAISALGILHDQSAVNRLQCSPDLPIKLYNRSIRAIIDRVATDPQNIKLVAVVNILFICFEYFQGNLKAAASHITGGINLLNSWRQMSRNQLGKTWYQHNDSFESDFMETEIAPLLSLFNINSFQWGVGARGTVFLNQIDEKGHIILPDTFESLGEARAALLDLITFATWHFQQYDLRSGDNGPTDIEFALIYSLVQRNQDKWTAKFEDFVQRNEIKWKDAEKRAADAIYIMKHGFYCSVVTYQSERSGFDWDTNRSKYDATVTRRLVNLGVHATRFPDELSTAFSLDFGMIFPLHAVSWRSNWAHLHRKGLDLRTRIAEPESIKSANPYNSITSRILELEEAYIDWTPQTAQEEGHPPPKRLRIHDFNVAGTPLERPGKSPVFTVTFWSKIDGQNGPWYSMTESMSLGPGRVIEELTDEKPSV